MSDETCTGRSCRHEAHDVTGPDEVDARLQLAVQQRDETIEALGAAEAERNHWKRLHDLVRKSLACAISERDKAQADAAGMRGALEAVRTRQTGARFDLRGDPAIAAKVDAALSSETGKAILNELERAKKERDEFRTEKNRQADLLGTIRDAPACKECGGTGCAVVSAREPLIGSYTIPCPRCARLQQAVADEREQCAKTLEAAADDADNMASGWRTRGGEEMAHRKAKEANQLREGARLIRWQKKQAACAGCGGEGLVLSGGPDGGWEEPCPRCARGQEKQAEPVSSPSAEPRHTKEIPEGEK